MHNCNNPLYNDSKINLILALNLKNPRSMKLSVLLLCIYLFSVNVFAQKYQFEKDPLWIKSVEIPNKSLVKKYDVTSGFYLTLADYQVNLDINAWYTRNVINVVSYSGITEASQLSVTYDTSYQKLKIHHLYIWRNGVKIDRTKELEFKILNNEYNLQNGIYMGSIAVYCNLNDIRKDDLIDFAYTLLGKNPIFKNEKYIFQPLESTNPIDFYSFRVLYAKDKPYHYKCVGCDSSMTLDTGIIGNYRELAMRLSNIKAVTMENQLPSWVIPYKYFSLSSFNSWKEVNTWAQEVFSLKNDPSLQAVFKEIFTGKETIQEKINKIINYVQDDIRYMGIESGIGSIKPFPPEQVVKQRFGDCKDKSLLLISLLKKIGINKAYPVLVNTYMKQEVDKFYPSNEVFDHVIVRFDFEDTTYWVDPTFTQQGGDFKSLSVLDYGKVLVIGVAYDTLSTMPMQTALSVATITDEFTMKSFTDPATLVTKSIRSGLEADVRRLNLEQHSAEEISKYVTEDLKRFYPVVNKTADIQFQDDVANNIFSTIYNFEVDGFWQDGDKLGKEETAGLWIFKYEPSMLYSDFNTTACMERKFDCAQEYPINLNYSVLFRFPKDLLVHDRYSKNDNDAFYFDEKIEQVSSNSFRVTYRYRTKSPSIKVDVYEKICAEKNEIAKNLPIVIYFNK